LDLREPTVQRHEVVLLTFDHPVSAANVSIEILDRTVD
jgi:hypothetical protein